MWASLGLFPVAGQNLVLVNMPSLPHVTLQIGGNELVIETTGLVETDLGSETPPRAQYVQAATVNGRPLEHGYITGTALHTGGRLHIESGPEPSAWATTHRPPSESHSRISLRR